jgi:hypothetical protein
MKQKNNITGDSLISKPSTDSYRDNFDSIFHKDNQREDIKHGEKTDVNPKNDTTSRNAPPLNG